MSKLLRQFACKSVNSGFNFKVHTSFFSSMASRIDLKSEKDKSMSSHGNDSKADLRAAFKDMLSETPEKERSELLENILQRSNVQFASIADKVTVEFSKFVKLLLTHNLEMLLKEEQQLREKGMLDAKSYVVVSADLLTDISNCEKNEEDPTDSMNVLSGIYVFGILSGLILSIVTALIIQYVNFAVSTRDLLFILLGSLVLILFPLIFFGIEPYLKGVQRKHNELFHRFISFFQNKR